jgi:hypothetical protein
MKPPTCTASDIASAFMVSLDELHEIIKRHPDFPVAGANGLYSSVDVFAFIHRQYRKDKLASLRLKTFCAILKATDAASGKENRPLALS